MLKTGLIAAASMIAFGSLSAAEHPSSAKQGDNEPIVAETGSAASEGESANRGAIVINGSAPSGAGGIAVSQSAVLAPAFMPVTPFATYSMSGNAVNDAELQKQLQDIHEREQRLLQNPEYRDLLRARQRLGLRQSHQDLAEFLQISKEQADQLIDLLAEQRVREQGESIPTWAGRGDAAAAQAFMQKNRERQGANEAEIAALLGPSKFEEWKEYEQSGMARFLVQRFASSLPEDASLRAEQRRSLLRAMAREQRKMFEDRALSIPPGQMPDAEWLNRVRGQELERMAAANQRILDAAAQILSQRQLEQLDSMLQQELQGHSQRQVIFGGRSPLAPPVVLPSQP